MQSPLQAMQSHFCEPPQCQHLGLSTANLDSANVQTVLVLPEPPEDDSEPARLGLCCFVLPAFGYVDQSNTSNFETLNFASIVGSPPNSTSSRLILTRKQIRL